MSRIRQMTTQERDKWSRAIHIAIRDTGGDKRKLGGLRALRSAYATLMPFVDEEADTAYTDCRYRVGFSPKLLDDELTSDETLAIVMIHETLHNVKRHRQRFDEYGVMGPAVNIYTDLEINSLIVEGLCGIDLKNTDFMEYGWDWLIGDIVELDDDKKAAKATEAAHGVKTYKKGDRIWNGMLLPAVSPMFADCAPQLTAEEYRSILEQNGTIKQIDLESLCGNSSINGDAKNGQTSKSNTPGNGGNGSTQGVTNVERDNTQKDGGASDGEWVDRIDKGTNDELWNEVDAAGIHPISQTEDNKLRERMRYDIEEYQREKSCGNSAADGIINFALEALKPSVVDWRSLFRHVASRTANAATKGRDDYSYQRVNRRHVGRSYILPGLVAYKPRIRLAVDTSGSMGITDYLGVLSEAEGILRETNGDLEIVAIDTVVKDEPKRVKSIEEIKDSLVGGGGTDMAPAVLQVCAEQRKNRPDVLVIATDGYFDWSSLGRAAQNDEFNNVKLIVLVVRYEKDGAEAEREVAGYNDMMKQYRNDIQVVPVFA